MPQEPAERAKEDSTSCGFSSLGSASRAESAVLKTVNLCTMLIFTASNTCCRSEKSAPAGRSCHARNSAQPKQTQSEGARTVPAQQQCVGMPLLLSRWAGTCAAATTSRDRRGCAQAYSTAHRCDVPRQEAAQHCGIRRNCGHQQVRGRCHQNRGRLRTCQSIREVTSLSPHPARSWALGRRAAHRHVRSPHGRINVRWVDHDEVEGAAQLLTDDRVIDGCAQRRAASCSPRWR